MRNKKMKICLFMTTVLEHPGGCEKYMIDIAAYLSKKPNLEVDIVTMDDQFTDRIGKLLSIFHGKSRKRSHYLIHADIIEQIGNAHYFKINNIKALKKKLKTYNVIYSKNELLEAFLLKFFIKYDDLPPVIFGGHTPLFYPIANSFYSKLHNFMYTGALYKYLGNGINTFHALNEYDADLYKSLFPAKQITIIPNPFDAKSFRQTAKKYKLPQADFDSSLINILWAGRLTEQKGVLDLYKIVTTVNKSVDMQNKIRWNICGDGELHYVAKKLSEEHKNVRYFGYIDQKYMPSLYYNNQIYLSTSKWESYQYTLVEAQAFGLQIVGYDIPVVGDFLRNYDNGYHVANIMELIETLSGLLRRKAFIYSDSHDKYVEQYNPEIIYSNVLRIMLETQRGYYEQ
jgi:glycosyltransferase involved in cell wall biosynthesis